MLGGVLAPDEDLRKPQPDEVLGSNRAMMLAFCETRDWLTKAFKELQDLHHIAEIHARMVPPLASLMHEMEMSEAMFSK